MYRVAPQLPVAVPLLALLLLSAVSALPAQTLSKTLVAGGFDRPVFVTMPPGDMDRLFVVEQGNAAARLARIRIIRGGSVLPTPFLDIDSLVANSGNERGLLGLAFHPDYWNNGYFYVNYTNTSGTTIIARYQVSANPDVANPGSAQVVMSIPQPFSNHNGGMIAFGPDGYLYIGMGDGGSANDPGNRAQTVTDLLGKMLRIDVDNPAAGLPYGIPSGNPYIGLAGRDEIIHIGVRNPWRFSFDRMTGDLFIGDVGQNAWEEVSVAPSGSSGLNFGWRCMEGNVCSGLGGCTCFSAALTPAAHVYGHNSAGGFSITGGYVYRGCAIPALQGTYFFADYVTNNIWTATYDPMTGNLTGVTSRNAELQGGLAGIASFGEDPAGELYIVSRDGGTVHKIVSPTSGSTLGLGGSTVIGGTFNVNLSAPGQAGRAYIFGISGDTEPAIPLMDGRTVPLALDDLLSFILLNPVNGVVNPYGTLGPNASAAVAITTPNDPGLMGLTFWSAFLVLDPNASAGVAVVSCPLALGF